MNYRDACMKYNVRRQEILNEAERAVEVSYALMDSYKRFNCQAGLGTISL